MLGVLRTSFHLYTLLAWKQEKKPALCSCRGFFLLQGQSLYPELKNVNVLRSCKMSSSLSVEISDLISDF